MLLRVCIAMVLKTENDVGTHGTVFGGASEEWAPHHTGPHRLAELGCEQADPRENGQGESGSPTSDTVVDHHDTLEEEAYRGLDDHLVQSQEKFLSATDRHHNIRSVPHHREDDGLQHHRTEHEDGYQIGGEKGGHDPSDHSCYCCS